MKIQERSDSYLKELESKWEIVVKRVASQFGEELDLQAILFLIGVQELGKGYRKFNKDQKLEVMHIAICTLLEPIGYYKFVGNDEDGFPHWELAEELPALKPGHQMAVMKEAIIDYFQSNALIEQ
jgi:hypothetical protein